MTETCVKDVQAGIKGQFPTIDIVPYTNRVINFLKKNPSDYYMLLNNDIHYYTIFENVSKESNYERLADEVISLIKGIGDPVDISFEQEDMLTFWVRPEGATTANHYVLFNYDWGVIRVD